MLALIIPSIISYLCGTTPSGYLIAKAYGVDVRKQGSGSVGATNLARTVGKKAGLLTLLLDVLKGFLPLLVFSYLGFSYKNLCLFGFLIVAGHCLSIPGVLKGGKGVATTAGVTLFLHPLTLVTGLAGFALSFYTTKIVSFSSLIAGLTLILSSFLYGSDRSLSLMLMGIVLLVFYRHRENIVRLLKNEEARFKVK